MSGLSEQTQGVDRKCPEEKRDFNKPTPKYTVSIFASPIVENVWYKIARRRGLIIRESKQTH